MPNKSFSDNQVVENLSLTTGPIKDTWKFSTDTLGNKLKNN